MKVPDDQDPIAAIPVGDGIQFEFNDLKKPFVCDYARCGVFVTSYGRFWMLNSILPHLDSIVRIHTDSILCLKEIPELKVTEKTGHWKLERYSKAEINHQYRKPKFTK